jgi:hypothetical protein
MLVTLAPNTAAFVEAQMGLWNKASSSCKFSLTLYLANVSGQIGPARRSPCRVVAPHWYTPWRTCWGVEAHQQHEASTAEQQTPQGMRSMPYKVFKS